MPGADLAVWKALIAVSGVAYLIWERARFLKRRAARGVLFALAVAACGAYFHFGNLPFDGYYHRWEMFHYYLGSKYSSEVGYKGLYGCVAVADAEAGDPEVVRLRRMRDLDTDGLVRASLFVDAPEKCKKSFSIARWEGFKSDVSWFRRAAASDVWWEEMQQDHGYNAPPAFTLLVRPLTELAPPSSRSLFLLASIDVGLMVASVVLLGWAFGARVAAIAAIFWGTQAPSEFFWTGGALLRQDWLFSLVLALCLLRKKQAFWAGVALALSASLRIFPVLFFAGPLLLVSSAWFRKRELTFDHQRFFLGSALCFALVGGASFVAVGPRAYSDFADRVELRATEPISNHMSLRTLFSASSDARLEHKLTPTLLDPAAPWAAARSAHLQKLAPFFAVVALGFLALWTRAVVRVRSLWVALALGVALVPAVTDPSSYYYSFVLLAVPLSRVVPALEVAFLGLAGAGQILALRFAWVDDRYAALALLYVAFMLALTMSFSRKLGRSPWWRLRTADPS